MELNKFIQVTSVDGVIDNLNITIRDDAFSIGSTYTFNTNSTTLRLINPIRFDGRSDVKFTFNNKVNSNIYGDIYLNPISSYERILHLNGMVIFMVEIKIIVV